MWSITEENPWNIQSLYDLQFFNCPSCDFKDYLKQDFVNHAHKFHPEAYPYLNNIKDGSTDDVLIPNEDNIFDFKPEFDSDISSPHTGLDVKIEEFDDMGNNENVKSDKQKLSFDATLDLKPELATDISSPYSGLDLNIDEFNNLKMTQNVKMDDQKLSFDTSYVALELEDFKTDHIYKLDHKCERCNEAFLTKKELISHYNVEHKELKLFKCNVCEESFGISKQLISHTRFSKCGNNNPLFITKRSKKKKKKQCEVCNLWVTQKYYPTHVLKHEQLSEICKCDKCNEQFQDRISLREHYITTKCKGRSKLICKICTMWVQSKYITKHLKKHEEGEIIHCEICQQEFPDVLMFKVHVRNVHGGQKRDTVDSKNKNKIKCEKCDKLVRDIFYPKHFIKKHSPKIKCEICDKFFRHTFYPKHVELMHQAGSYMCEHCAKVFKTKHLLNNHVMIHGENNHTACKICGKMLTKATVKLHIRRVHEKKKDWVCMTCGKEFSEKGCMDKHEQRMHGGIKKHKCPFPKCESAFHQNSELQNHIKTVHEGRKDYKCSECGKAFGNIKNVKRHRETVHELVKKFKCHLCTNAYGQSHELKKHYVNFHKQIIPKFKTISEFQKQMITHDNDIK